MENIPVPQFPITAYLVGNKAIVYNFDEGSYLYCSGGYFGAPLGIKKPRGNHFDKPLELSLYEALYLIEKGILVVKNNDESIVGKEEIIKIGNQNDAQFSDKYDIYKDLRDKRYVVRPGQKFGTDFAVYIEGPGKDHSPYVVQVFPKNSMISALDIVRVGRLATTVKKKFVIAIAATLSYYVFNWKKP